MLPPERRTIRKNSSRSSKTDCALHLSINVTVPDEARKLGFEIVHPITTEPWGGVRRFFVRAPDGNVINIVSHRD